MKNSFFIHIILPDYFTAGFYELVPKQRILINDLLEKRIILNYSLDMERKNVWVFMEAKNQEEVSEILNTFPIIKHVSFSIHELAFYDTAPVSLPDLMLN